MWELNETIKAKITLDVRCNIIARVDSSLVNRLQTAFPLTVKKRQRKRERMRVGAAFY